MPVLSCWTLTSRPFGAHTLSSLFAISLFVPTPLAFAMTVMVMATVWVLVILLPRCMHYRILRHELVGPETPLMMVMLMMAVGGALVVIGTIAVMLARAVVCRFCSRRRCSCGCSRRRFLRLGFCGGHLIRGDLSSR